MLNREINWCPTNYKGLVWDMNWDAIYLKAVMAFHTTTLRFLYGLHSTRHHVGCQRSFANSKLQMICNIDHTWVTSCVCPSWFASKTYPFLYVTDFVFTVSWTLLITFIPIYSGPFTAWNEQIKLRFFDTLVIFHTLFYVNLIIVCTYVCILYFNFLLKEYSLWTVE